MPREIITLQAGQCGNQSILNIDFIYLYSYCLYKQLVVNFGNKSVLNTELARMALWNHSQQKGVIERTCFSIK